MTLIQFKPKNLGIWLIGLVMLLVPIYYTSDTFLGMAGIRVTQQQMYQVSAIALFSIFILQNIWLSAFMLWSLFLYCYFEFANPVGLVVITLLSGCIIYEAVYRIVNKDNVKMIYNFLIAFMLINMAYMIMQGFGLELMFKEWQHPNFQTQLIGFMGLKAIMGMLFAICMPFVAFRYPKLALGLFVPLYYSECSSAVGAAIIAYLWQIWFISRKWFFILIGIMCLGGILYAYNDSHAGMFTDRANMWKTVLRDAVKKPITGWGPDSFRCITPDKQFIYFKNNRTLETFPIDVKDTIEYEHTGKYDLVKYGKFMKEGDSLNPWDNPHNEYIQLFLEFGIVGVILLGFLIYDISKRFNPLNIYTIPLIGFFLSILVMSVGQFPFHLTRIGIYIPIFLACYYKLTEPEWKS